MRSEMLVRAGVVISGLLLIGLSSTVSALPSVPQTPQKKERTVKVLVREGSKLVEKDSTYVGGTGKGIFYAGKNVVFKADSLVLHRDGNNKTQTVTLIIQDDKQGAGKDSTKYTCTVVSQDSVSRTVGHSMAGAGDGKGMIIMQNVDSGSFNMSGSTPAVAGYRIGRPLHDPFSFDPGDQDIVSFKKKDLGKGLERITIVRKKSVVTEEKEVEMKILK